MAIQDVVRVALKTVPAVYVVDVLDAYTIGEQMIKARKARRPITVTAMARQAKRSVQWVELACRVADEFTREEVRSFVSLATEHRHSFRWSDLTALTRYWKVEHHQRVYLAQTACRRGYSAATIKKHMEDYFDANVVWNKVHEYVVCYDAYKQDILNGDYFGEPAQLLKRAADKYHEWRYGTPVVEECPSVAPVTKEVCSPPATESNNYPCFYEYSGCLYNTKSESSTKTTWPSHHFWMSMTKNTHSLSV